MLMALLVTPSCDAVIVDTPCCAALKRPAPSLENTDASERLYDAVFVMSLVVQWKVEGFGEVVVTRDPLK